MARSIITLLTVSLAAIALGACGDDEPDPSPPDPGLADPLPPGETVELDGLNYTVPFSRQLNPRTRPDRSLVGRRRPEEGNLLFGVFLRACNEEGGEAETAEPQITLTTSPFNQTFRPVPLPAGNAFGWEPATIQPGECRPQQSAVEPDYTEGSLVLFELPREALTDRPLVLRLQEGGEVQRVELDL